MQSPHIISTKEADVQLSSAIGVALPSDPLKHGYLAEHHAFGEAAAGCGQYAEDLAVTMLATSLDAPYDFAQAEKERTLETKANGLVSSTHSTSQVSTSNDQGYWTTVVAAAVMILE